MTLADMIATDEDALICDFAETYQIYDYKTLPLSKVASFAVGLRDDSRIKMKKNGVNIPMNSLLLATIADRLTLLVWANTEDGQKGENMPKSLLSQLLGPDKEENIGFDTVEEYEKERKRVMERGEA